jgi:hypothetical protein
VKKIQATDIIWSVYACPRQPSSRCQKASFVSAKQNNKVLAKSLVIGEVTTKHLVVDVNITSRESNIAP